MKARKNERLFKFQARSMLPRNVNLPPTLIKGEYNGFDGGIVFPGQEPERQADLMKYPFVDNVINEKSPPVQVDWVKKLLPIANKGLKIKHRFDKAGVRQEQHIISENVKTAGQVGNIIGSVAGTGPGQIVSNVGKLLARRSGKTGLWVGR